MKIDFENSIRRLSFLCCLPDIKIAWINPFIGNLTYLELIFRRKLWVSSPIYDFSKIFNPL